MFSKIVAPPSDEQHESPFSFYFSFVGTADLYRLIPDHNFPYRHFIIYFFYFSCLFLFLLCVSLTRHFIPVWLKSEFTVQFYRIRIFIFFITYFSIRPKNP